MDGFESRSPAVVNTLLTIAGFPDGTAIMEFNNQTYEVTVKPAQPKPRAIKGDKNGQV